MLRMSLTMLALVIGFASAGWSQTGGSSGDTKASKPAAMVNLNTATLADLETLPGIGAKVAARIIEYRNKKGPFRKVEELMNVQGIGEKSFLKLRPQLTVAAKTDAAGQN